MISRLTLRRAPITREGERVETVLPSAQRLRIDIPFNKLHSRLLKWHNPTSQNTCYTELDITAIRTERRVRVCGACPADRRSSTGGRYGDFQWTLNNPAQFHSSNWPSKPRSPVRPNATPISLIYPSSQIVRGNEGGTQGRVGRLVRLTEVRGFTAIAKCVRVRGS